jgi:hypothetical protein
MYIVHVSINDQQFAYFYFIHDFIKEALKLSKTRDVDDAVSFLKHQEGYLTKFKTKVKRSNFLEIT